jgi:hypothetical protein
MNEPIDLECKKNNEQFWKVRRYSRKGVVHTRRLGVVLTRRNRHRRPSGSVRWRAPLRAAWRPRERGKGWGGRGDWCSFYRRGDVAYLARDHGELRGGEDHSSGEPIGETFGRGLGMTPRSHCQREEEERKISVWGEKGNWAVVDSGGGPNRYPGPFYIFFFLSSFSFSVFLFLSYLFQIWSKLIQTSL